MKGCAARGNSRAAETAPPKAVMRGTAKKQVPGMTPHPSLRDTFPRGGRLLPPRIRRDDGLGAEDSLTARYFAPMGLVLSFVLQSPLCPPFAQGGHGYALVIPPDARRNACLQEHFDEAAHEREARISEARNPVARDKMQMRGDPSHTFGMTGWGRTG